MKAITLHQPWAEFIVKGLKDLENRQRRTSIRGWVLVHASKTFDGRALDFLNERSPRISHPVMLARFMHAKVIAKKGKGESGGIIGAMRIDDCVSSSDNPWFMGKHAYVIGAVKMLPFFPCRGFQGWFDVDLPPDIAAQIPGISYRIEWDGKERP